MDVLNQVPGFTFGVDVQNTVGLGSRGNWGHEGKILLLIDGMEMNEVLFSTLQFGQHYDINNIERIEIIRGPGSSIYGGYAELGVINIITRSGSQINGVSGGASYGRVARGMSRMTQNLMAGGGAKKWNYSFSGQYGKAIRSDKTYRDLYGTEVDLFQNSSLRPMMINMGGQAGNLTARAIYDGYYLMTADQYDQAILSPVDKVRFNTLFTTVKYDFKINSRVTITPKVNYKSGTPWMTGNEAAIPYSIRARRLAPGINVELNPRQDVNLVLGADSYFDRAQHTGSDAEYFGSLANGNQVSFYNIGAFAQAVLKTLPGNITIGARLDNHSQFGAAYSPRVGFTRAWKKIHLKGLYSKAFRSPAIENLNYNPDVKPERTGVAEVELGYQFTDHMIVTVNGYHIRINNPIVYYVDTDNPVGTYDNFTHSGTQGFELDYRIKSKWGYVSTNYSYYTAERLNAVPYYQSEDPKSVLGLPSSRLNVNGSVQLSRSLSVNPSLNLFSKRHAVNGINENGELETGTIGSEFITNLFFRFKTGDLDLGAGLYNLTDCDQVFVQPYGGGHLPLPGLGREFALSLQYTFSFAR
jgi:outer membrane cobalamin receptor